MKKNLVLTFGSIFLLLLVSQNNILFGDIITRISTVFLLILIPSFYAQFPVKNESFCVSSFGDKVMAFSVVSFANAVTIFVIPALAGYLFGLKVNQVLFFYLVSCF